MDVYEDFKLKDIKCFGECVMNTANKIWYGCNSCTCKRGQVYKYLSLIHQP